MEKLGGVLGSSVRMASATAYLKAGSGRLVAALVNDRSPKGASSTNHLDIRKFPLVQCCFWKDHTPNILHNEKASIKVSK